MSFQQFQARVYSRRGYANYKVLDDFNQSSDLNEEETFKN